MPTEPVIKAFVTTWLDANIASLKRLGYTRADCYAAKDYIVIRTHFPTTTSGEMLFPLFRRDIERAVRPTKFDRIINQLTVYLIEHPGTHLSTRLTYFPKG